MFTLWAPAEAQWRARQARAAAPVRALGDFGGLEVSGEIRVLRPVRAAACGPLRTATPTVISLRDLTTSLDLKTCHISEKKSVTFLWLKWRFVLVFFYQRIIQQRSHAGGGASPPPHLLTIDLSIILTCQQILKINLISITINNAGCLCYPHQICHIMHVSRGFSVCCLLYRLIALNTTARSA